MINKLSQKERLPVGSLPFLRWFIENRSCHCYRLPAGALLLSALWELQQALQVREPRAAAEPQAAEEREARQVHDQPCLPCRALRAEESDARDARV